MKKTLLAAILTLAMMITLSALASVPTQAKTRDYWVRGYCGGMGLKRKQMKAAYHGYKISRKCKVGAGGYERTYKRFLADRGRTGQLEGFVDLHVKNNRVIYIDYGF